MQGVTSFPMARGPVECVSGCRVVILLSGSSPPAVTSLAHSDSSLSLPGL